MQGRPGSDTNTELERIRLRNHLLVLGLGLLLFAIDALVTLASGRGYAGEVVVRSATFLFGAVLLVRLLRHRKPKPAWEAAGLVGLMAGAYLQLLLHAWAGGLDAFVLIGSGYWLYLLYVYAFSLVSGRAGLILDLGVIVMVSAGLGPLWSSATDEGRVAFIAYQAGAVMAVVVGWALAGWRNAFLAAQQRIEAAEYESLTDALTGQPNRRALRFTVAREIARARRTGRPFALHLLDIDHFKLFNDKHGHAVGDAVLREFAGVIRGALRQGDEFGRWGGEEFVVVAPSTERSEALMLAGRLRAALHEHDWPFTPVLASIGITLSRPGDTIEQLFDRADAALYRAKESGRDRSELVLAGDPFAGSETDAAPVTEAAEAEPAEPAEPQGV